VRASSDGPTTTPAEIKSSARSACRRLRVCGSRWTRSTTSWSRHCPLCRPPRRSPARWRLGRQPPRRSSRNGEAPTPTP